jgi:gliding motility-associated-like protein
MRQKLYTLLLLLLLPLCGFAQHEASTWYLDNGYAMKFRQGNVSIEKEGPVAGFGASTYSYDEGKVLLYTTGQYVYNKDGRRIKNGVLEHTQIINQAIITPKPGSHNLFYIFYLGFAKINPTDQELTNHAVMYAIVDVTAENGLGAVLEKDKVIYTNLHGSFTVSAICATNAYWLVGETNTNIDPSIKSDQLLAFKIDASGIAKEPVRSTPVNIGNSSDLKFSPRGDRLLFRHSGGYNGETGVGLTTFDAVTGRIDNYIKLDYSHTASEFSATGDMVYVGTTHNGITNLLQFDLTAGTPQQILASKTVVHTPSWPLHVLQLAPNGKIYFSIVYDKRNILSVINYPDRKGADCDVESDFFTFSSPLPYHYSRFATNFLYNSPLKPDAGADKEICANQSTQLGGTNKPGYTYHWEPATYLSSPDSPTPTFTYPHATSEKLEFTYTLYVKEGDCFIPDVVTVTVLPTPEKPPITGSKSVCPGVEGVDYSVAPQQGYTYRWDVSGGQIQSGQGTAAIKVTWGPANAHAQVRLIVTSEFGCESEQAVLPVRINVQLTPETPQGPASVCLNQAARNVYKVTNTTGSVYTWGIKGGILVNGQGTNQVTVSWQGIGNHELWIQEQSTTVDTVCFGISDKLHIQVFRDPTAIALDYVSITSDEGDASQQQWHLSKTLTTASAITLHRRVLGTDTWANTAELPTDARDHTDAGLQGREEIYEYKVATTNHCDEPIESGIHRTIRLETQEQPEQDRITLTWNAYTGWTNGVAHYEVWRKLDNEEEYQLLLTVDGNSLSSSSLNAAVGFQHHYKIKAMAAGAAWSSWSNAVALTFDHALNIPNIFTPNGDGYNDTFFIPKLDLYPDNELVVVNRQGKEVYRKKGYQGNWTGANLATGSYFYQLYIGRLNKHYRGWVELVK